MRRWWRRSCCRRAAVQQWRQAARSFLLGGCDVTCERIMRNPSCACGRLDASSRGCVAPSQRVTRQRRPWRVSPCVTPCAHAPAWRRACARASAAFAGAQRLQLLRTRHGRAACGWLDAERTASSSERAPRGDDAQGACAQARRGCAAASTRADSALLGGVAEPARRLSVLRGPPGGRRGSWVRTLLGGTRMLCSQRLASQAAWARALGERRTRQRRP
jgi:hypothetical protein